MRTFNIALHYCLVMATSSDDTDSVFHLRIRSFKDVEIAVPATSVVAHVKQQVRAALEQEDNDRYLRLICKGRLLLPDDYPISDFNVQNGDVVHAVLAPANAEDDSRRRQRRHGTIVGPGGRVTRAPVNHDEDDSSAASYEFDDEAMEQGQGARPRSRQESFFLR